MTQTQSRPSHTYGSHRHPAWLFSAFALGYFFSAMLRAVTATLAPQFSQELNLSAADLGLLAGVFFAGFACTQLPLGSALDRLGPKRVLMAMMLLAVAASVAFAMASSFQGLLLARALMGVGLSASLMAALTAFRYAFGPAAQLRASSWMLMTGSLGMLASTLPVHALLPLVGWRGLFWCTAAALLLSICFLACIVPRDEQRPAAPPSQQASGQEGLQDAGYGVIFRHPRFVRYMPMGFWHYGGLIAVQTLWAGPWMTRVAGYSAAESARGLFIINLCMLCSFALLGWIVPRFSAWGWETERLVRWASPLSCLLMLLLIVMGAQAGQGLLAVWCMSCVIISLSQPRVGQAFASHLVGRALSAYNLGIFLGVFCMQWGLGLVIDAFSGMGWPTEQAFRGAFSVYLTGAVACWLWFIWKKERPVAAL